MTDQLIPGDLLTRTKVITGLRQLADYLQDHPGLPVTRLGWDLNTYPRHGDGDSAARAEVDRVATILGVRVTDETPRGGHYLAARAFGLISYAAVHIPAPQMATHPALMSYCDCVTPTGVEVTA